MVIWDEVQTCIRPSRCHCHSLFLAPVNPDWFYLPGFYLSGTCLPGWSRTNSRRAVKQLCVCVRESSSVGVSPETKLSNYAAELCHGSVTNCTAGTEFWKACKACYLLLSKVALDLPSVPASEAYTERLFRVCGDLTAGKCNRMTSSLKRRVILRLNLKYHE